LACIRIVPTSNLFPNTKFPAWGFLVLFSIPSKQISVECPKLGQHFKFCISYHEIFRKYLTLSLQKLPKNKCNLLLSPTTSSFHSNYEIFVPFKRITLFFFSGLPASSISAGTFKQLRRFKFYRVLIYAFRWVVLDDFISSSFSFKNS